MNIPDELLYTDEHEWIHLEGNQATIGITDHAQEQLGDVVFVELPEVDEEFDKGDSIGTVESTKAVSDIFAPLTGGIIAINEELPGNPEIINQKPYDDGWMVKLEISDPAEIEDLMSAKEYTRFIDESE